MGEIKVTFAHEGKEYVLEGLDANEVEVEFTLHCGEETYTFDSWGEHEEILNKLFPTVLGSIRFIKDKESK